MTEVRLQREPLRQAWAMVEILKNFGLLKENLRLENPMEEVHAYEEGIKASYGSFIFQTGGQEYVIVGEHKPGSGSPRSNSLLRQIERGNLRSDNFFASVAGHQHYAGVAQEGIRGSNQVRHIWKGGTMADHDAYGKAGDWGPPTIGVLEVDVAENPGPQRPPRHYFRLSDVLQSDS